MSGMKKIERFLLLVGQWLLLETDRNDETEMLFYVGGVGALVISESICVRKRSLVA